MTLRLNTLQNVRSSLARVARETARGTLDVARGSLLTRQLSALLAHDRSMVSLDIDERLAAIEQRLDEADEALAGSSLGRPVRRSEPSRAGGFGADAACLDPSQR